MRHACVFIAIVFNCVSAHLDVRNSNGILGEYNYILMKLLYLNKAINCSMDLLRMFFKMIQIVIVKCI